MNEQHSVQHDNNLDPLIRTLCCLVKRISNFIELSPKRLTTLSSEYSR